MKILTTSKTITIGQTELITLLAGTETKYTFTPTKEASCTVKIEIVEEIKE